MNDIVERLRKLAERERPYGSLPDTLDEAADRIAQLEAALIDAVASLAAAISLLERGGKKAAASDKMFAIMLDDYRKSLDSACAALGEERT